MRRAPPAGHLQKHTFRVQGSSNPSRKVLPLVCLCRFCFGSVKSRCLPVSPTRPVIFHTFTVRSMEPVAIHGMVGDTATAVTYLQGGVRGAGSVKGVCVCVCERRVSFSQVTSTVKGRRERGKIVHYLKTLSCTSKRSAGFLPAVPLQ